jgi:4-amino-4-deoxy-L-arabinose transferase-like glycosyltransferase
VNALIGTLTVVVVHRLARRYLDPTRARVAAGLAALHPGLIVYSAVVMTEPLAGLLVLVAGLAFARYWPRTTAVLLVGVVLGFATLVRPSMLLAAPLLLLMTDKASWASAARVASITVLAVFLVLPWSIRNCARMDGCAFVSTNGGWNLAIGALTQSGRFESLDGKGCPVVKGQVEQDRCWATVGRRAILESPGHWLGLMPKKLGHTYDHESFAIEYLREADPGAWPEPRRVAGRELLSFFHRLLLIAAALGTLARPNFRELFEFARSKFEKAPSRETIARTLAIVVLALIVLYAFADIRHPFYLLAVLIPIVPLLPLPGRLIHGSVGRYLLALVALTSFTHAIFFGDDRYHLVVSPVLCILAAGALRPK